MVLLAACGGRCGEPAPIVEDGVPRFETLDPYEHPPIELPAGLPLEATFGALGQPVRGGPAPPSPKATVPLAWVELEGGELTVPWWSEGPPEPLYPRRSAVAPFSMMRTEATVGMYRACVAAGTCSADAVLATLHGEERPEWSANCTYPRDDAEDQPINCVTVADARAFCSWAGGRLPTEAEWVWAAGAARGWLHPWGDAPPDCDRAVMYWPGHGWGCDGDGLQPPCSRAPGTTPEGVCDLAGNVWERVERCGPGRDQLCAHGGSAGYPSPLTLLTAARIVDDGVTRADDIGIRCAKDRK